VLHFGKPYGSMNKDVLLFSGVARATPAGITSSPFWHADAGAFCLLPSPAQLPLSNRYGALECEGLATEEVW